jgi:transmembrane 9 superfamily protein 2/4
MMTLMMLMTMTMTVMMIIMILMTLVMLITTTSLHSPQNHRWWWSAFLSSGGVSIYVFLYSMYYFWAKLHIVSLAPALLYFGYSTILAFTFFLLSGSTDRYACRECAV